MIYQKRLSGPLLDRIDIHKAPALWGIEVPRDIQAVRFSTIESSNIACNADMRIAYEICHETDLY